MKRELVLVIDFGGQYNQLVARRVRESNVYCEIYSYRVAMQKIKELNPKGIILTGGPNSCNMRKRTFRMWCSGTWLMLWCSANAVCIRWKCRSCTY